MMKAKFLIIFALICVTLSFFSVGYANQDLTTSNDYFSIDWNNAQDNEQVVTTGSQTEIIVENTNGLPVIKCNKTGIYTISCSSLDDELTTIKSENKGEFNVQFKYAVDSYGGQQYSSDAGLLTIPGVVVNTDDGEKIQLYQDYVCNGNTTIVVYLQKGEVYEINGDSNADFKLTYCPPGSKVNGVTVAQNSSIVVTDYSTYPKSMNTYNDGGKIRGVAGGSNQNKKNIVSIKEKGSDYVIGPNAESSSTGSSQSTSGGSSQSTSGGGSQSTSGGSTSTSVGDLSNVASDNPFETGLVNIFLKVGDFAMKVLDDVVGEEVTVTKLVYNQVKTVDANFFNSNNSNGFGGSKFREAINDWYQTFKALAITVYLIALLGIGVHVLMNSTGAGMQKARELLAEWAKGVVILFFMPLAMRWIFQINEALIMAVSPDDYRAQSVGSSFNSSDEWSAEDIEFRSPKFVSKYTGKVTYGTDEANNAYMRNLTAYKNSLDLMRIMRAYAGATGKFGYTVLWYVLIGQLIVFVFMYYKRYFMIAFLIAVFPVVCIFNAISIIKGKKGPQFSTWVKEFLTNVFTQFIHALIYTIITGIIVSVVKDNLLGSTSTGAMNWIIIIVAINFVPEGEKVVKKFITSIGSGKTGPDAQGSAGGLKNMYHNATSNIKQIMGARR